MNTSAPLTLKKIRELHVDAPTQEGRANFLSSASGLVHFKEFWYVISDDENALARFPGDDTQLGTFVKTVFDAALPLEKKKRKKAKSDFEALAVVDELLLAIPSGSKPNRCLGAIFPFHSDGSLGEHRVINFEELFTKLSSELGALNIEGIVITQNLFQLFNRGNSVKGKNAVITLERDAAFNELRNYSSLSTFREIREIDLGEISGRSYGFTDACADGDGDGALFLAAAEDTESTYDDGSYLGAMIGQIDASGVRWMRPLLCPEKPEGIWLVDGKNRIRIVTDSDDETIPSAIYEGTL